MNSTIATFTASWPQLGPRGLYRKMAVAKTSRNLRMARERKCVRVAKLRVSSEIGAIQEH